jgi:hypothetical protein
MADLDGTERRVLEMLLAGEHPTLTTLREQLRQTAVVNRTFLPTGFFTELRVDADAAKPLQPPRSPVIGDVNADAEGLQFGCGFLLFVVDGWLSTLECHRWGPEEMRHPLRIKRFWYSRGPNVTESPQRDFESLLKALE